MSPIPTPSDVNAAPLAFRSLLEAVKRQLGSVPNLFRMVATSPAALDFAAVATAKAARGVRS